MRNRPAVPAALAGLGRQVAACGPGAARAHSRLTLGDEAVAGETAG
ncbi:hypothetical protein [Nonomuraea pusilla]|uniref:Uncharacterized protein n=1 Tax=Nonomuraea pusilla TaxID=46177 RepID=A0A1H7IG92_9ACTN|nr:hypothetical protein [Nonomuraea pusilla]SEK60550.1 hypothetical protein SAMN05660976_00770 [Nonomuraea pusilla]